MRENLEDVRDERGVCYTMRSRVYVKDVIKLMSNEGLKIESDL